MPDVIKSLCLAGAFNKGIAYVGCLQKLEDLKMIRLEKIVGVSIGSLIAMSYVIGYSPIEMYKLIVEKDTKEFMDFSVINSSSSVLKGSSYRKWVHEVIQSRILKNGWITDHDETFTMKQLKSKTGIEIVVVATCISKTEKFEEGIVHFSAENTPDIPISSAIIASMSFPFLFPPFEYEGAYFIDGGVLQNFPMNLIDSDGLGICPKYTPLNGIDSTKNPVSYISKIFELISEYSDSSRSYSNVIRLDCNRFNSLFNMSIDDKITLYKIGYEAIAEADAAT